MKTLFAIAAIAATLVTAPIVEAKIYSYACSYPPDSEQYKSDRRLHVAKFDPGKRTLTFMGKVYRNMKKVRCPMKECFLNDQASLELLTNANAGLSVDGGRSELDCTEVFD